MPSLLEELSRPLMQIYTSFEDEYYHWVDYLESKGIPIGKWYVEPLESRGIPSFLVLVIFCLLLLISAIGFGWWFFGQSGDNLSVYVYSNDTLVEGAEVQVLRQDVILANSTTIRGKAILSVPGGLVKITAIKEGCQAANDTADVSRRSFVKLQLVCIEPTPTPNPTPEYRPVEPTPVPTPEATLPQPTVFPVSVASLSFTVTDRNDRALNAKLTVYQSGSDIKHGAYEVNNGAHIVENLVIGNSYYFSIESPGYIGHANRGSPLKIEAGGNKYSAKLISLGDLSNNRVVSVFVVDSSDRPLSNASVDVYEKKVKSPYAYAHPTNASGIAVFNLPPAEYFAVGYKSGYYLGYSKAYPTGNLSSPIKIILNERNASEKTSLEVNVQIAGSNTQVSGASVGVFSFTSDNEAFSIAQGKTPSVGSLFFEDIALPRTSRILGVASYGDQQGENDGSLANPSNRLLIPIGSKKIQILTVGEDNFRQEGVKVDLYLKGSQSPIASQTTNASGATSFKIGMIQYFAIGSKKGFYTTGSTELFSSANANSSIILLMRARPTNEKTALYVTVVNGSNFKPAPSANVKLFGVLDSNETFYLAGGNTSESGSWVVDDVPLARNSEVLGNAKLNEASGETKSKLNSENNSMTIAIGEIPTPIPTPVPPVIQNNVDFTFSASQRQQNGSYALHPYVFTDTSTCQPIEIESTENQVGATKCAGAYLIPSLLTQINESASVGSVVSVSFSNKALSSSEILQGTFSIKSSNGTVKFIGVDNATFVTGALFQINAPLTKGDILNLSLKIRPKSVGGADTRSKSYIAFNFSILANGKYNAFSNRMDIGLPNVCVSCTTPQNFLEMFPCGNSSAYSLSSSNGSLIASCRKLYMVVDSIFPADAFPLTLDNKTQENCGTLLYNVKSQNPVFADPKVFYFDVQKSMFVFDARKIIPGNYAGPSILGNASVDLACTRMEIGLNATVEFRYRDARVNAVDGSYIFFGKTYADATTNNTLSRGRELVYSLYNGQFPQSLIINAPGDSSRIQNSTEQPLKYWIINTNSKPVSVSVLGTSPETGILIKETNHRIGSIFGHLTAVAHLDIRTLDGYSNYTRVVSLPGLKSSEATMCKALDYVSDVTRQIPYAFMVESQAVATASAFRRAKPQTNVLYCGKRNGEDFASCYPNLLNWVNASIIQETGNVSCTPCAPLLDFDLTPANYPDFDFSGFNTSDQTEYKTSPSSFAEGTNAIQVRETLRFDINTTNHLGVNYTGNLTLQYQNTTSSSTPASLISDCKVGGGKWCNSGISFTKLDGDVWTAAVPFTFQNDGLWVFRVDSTNGHFAPTQVVVLNKAQTCHFISTGIQPMCANAYEPGKCDLTCPKNGVKTSITSAGPPLGSPSFWLNSTPIQKIPYPSIVGMDKMDGMPMKYFLPEKNFTLTTPLMYWSRNINDLPEQLKAPAREFCTNGLGFYQLTATSKEGRNWTYSLGGLSVTPHEYLLNSEPSDSGQFIKAYAEKTYSSLFDSADFDERNIYRGSYNTPYSDYLGCSIGFQAGKDKAWPFRSPFFPTNVFPLCNFVMNEVGMHVHACPGDICNCVTKCGLENCGGCGCPGWVKVGETPDSRFWTSPSCYAESIVIQN